MRVLPLYAGLCLVYLFLYSPFFLIPLAAALGIGYLGNGTVTSVFIIIFFISFLITSIRVGIRTRLSLVLMLKDKKGFKETVKTSGILMKKRFGNSFIRIVRPGKNS